MGRPPFDVFNAESEDIEFYLERLQEYFTAYDIRNDTDSPAKRRAILLTSLGSGAYRVLKDLFLLDKYKDFWPACNAAEWLLLAHRLVSRRERPIYSTNQKPGQSIVEFVSGLKSLTGKCEFTNLLINDILRDRFICGLRAEQIKRKMIIGQLHFSRSRGRCNRPKNSVEGCTTLWRKSSWWKFCVGRKSG